MTGLAVGELLDAYMRHRTDRLVHEQAIEAIAMTTGIAMTDIDADLRRAGLRRPRHRTLRRLSRERSALPPPERLLSEITSDSSTAPPKKYRAADRTRNALA